MTYQTNEAQAAPNTKFEPTKKFEYGKRTYSEREILRLASRVSEVRGDQLFEATGFGKTVVISGLTGVYELPLEYICNSNGGKTKPINDRAKAEQN